MGKLVGTQKKLVGTWAETLRGPKGPQETPWSPQKDPKRPQEVPRRTPPGVLLKPHVGSQKDPKRPQEVPKKAHEQPTTNTEKIQTAALGVWFFSGVVGGALGAYRTPPSPPRWPQEASKRSQSVAKRSQEAPRGPQAIRRTCYPGAQGYQDYCTGGLVTLVQ